MERIRLPLVAVIIAALAFNASVGTATTVIVPDDCTDDPGGVGC